LEVLLPGDRSLPAIARMPGVQAGTFGAGGGAAVRAVADFAAPAGPRAAPCRAPGAWRTVSGGTRGGVAAVGPRVGIFLLPRRVGQCGGVVARVSVHVPGLRVVEAHRLQTARIRAGPGCRRQSRVHAHGRAANAPGIRQTLWRAAGSLKNAGLRQLLFVPVDAGQHFPRILTAVELRQAPEVS
jgi:hypothetical protein